MRKKKPQKVIEQLQITGIADQGVGIGRIEGKVIFAEKTIPGDVVDVRLSKNKKDFGVGVPILFHQKSPLRVEPFCEHFGICGGCTWQNIDYNTQLDFKQQLVKEAFERIGKIDLPSIDKIIPSPYEKYYRNKLEFTFSNRRWLTEKEMDETDDIKNLPALGFHIPKKHDKILDINHCYLQPSLSNEIRLAIKAYAIMYRLSFYDTKTQNGFLRNCIIRNTSLNDLMVILIVGEDNPDLLLPLLAHLQQTFSEITSLYYSINVKVNDYLYDLPMNLYAGSAYITEQIDHIKYRLGPKSFFQTNTEQAKNLYHNALQLADLKPEHLVYDLYTGLGSIALLAAQKCKKVIGVESIQSAIDDANINAELNGISNCEFVCGDMAKIFNDTFIQTYGKPDIIITDPPRAGMHKDVVTKLIELAAPRIIYVSCNAATQARDIQLLSEKYDVIKLMPVDMFPQTYHVENIALLELKNI